MFNKKLKDKITALERDTADYAESLIELQRKLAAALEESVKVLRLEDINRDLQIQVSKVNAKNKELLHEKKKLQHPERPDVPWADHEMTAEERTMKAKEIISNPLMMEIFRGLEDGLSNGARGADLSNHVELMSYTMGLQILDQIVDYIEDRITDEKVVEYNQKVANVANFKH